MQAHAIETPAETATSEARAKLVPACRCQRSFFCRAGRVPSRRCSGHGVCRAVLPRLSSLRMWSGSLDLAWTLLSTRKEKQFVHLASECDEGLQPWPNPRGPRCNTACGNAGQTVFPSTAQSTFIQPYVQVNATSTQSHAIAHYLLLRGREALINCAPHLLPFVSRIVRHVSSPKPDAMRA